MQVSRVILPLCLVLAACPRPAEEGELPSTQQDGGAGAPDASNDDGGAVDAGPGDGGPSCVTPTNRMVITQSTLLCPVELKADVLGGQAAIIIDADDVVLTCDRTVVTGSGFGTTQQPTVGIRVTARRNVVIRGCEVHGFRYGVSALGATHLTLDRMLLDDNFHDPAAGWAQDTIQGGGLRLEQVNGGAVLSSTFRRNWNGIELRHSRGVAIRGARADHCSNTGLTLVNSHENEISDGDFSWAIRGDNLSYPSHWYNVDTKDSAGIIIDATSSKNRVLRNDFRYGGDGVFIRALIGNCAEDNLIQGNDTSFSPHNAIECWCDDNRFIDNVASDSNYGIWLGGTDRGLVLHNEVERNWVDGISIQIGEDRHTVIEGNLIRNNGFQNERQFGWRPGVGLLLTGSQYQAWFKLTDLAKEELANSSHVLVQRNDFDHNAAADIFVSYSRAVVLASNCGANGAAPSLMTGPSTDLVQQVGSCRSADAGTAPSLSVTGPISAAQGTQVTFSARSGGGDGGTALNYQWAVQASGLRFKPPRLPPLLFTADGGASQSFTPAAPGAYDVLVTAHDGKLGALASAQVAILRSGLPLDDNAAKWTGVCQSKPDCKISLENQRGVDGDALKVTTDAPYDFALATPPTKDLNLNLSAPNARLSFFVRGYNPNENGGWQGPSPVLVLRNASGAVRYTPVSNHLPDNPSEWAYVEIPLSGTAPDAGPNSWVRSGDAGTLANVDWIELHMDTWGFRPYDVWFDGLVVDRPDGG